MQSYEGPGLDLTFYQDNCCGQNKNRFIVSLYSFCLRKYSKINSISHKFLITGHTQNEGDAVHSTIEKQIQRRLKSGPIYVPSQCVEVIRSAKKKGRPYNLTEMSSCYFISLKTLAQDMGIHAQDMGIHTQSFKILDVKILKIMKDSPTTIFYKTSFNQTEFLKAELSRKKNLGEINLKAAYRTKPKIKPNKINDLISLVESNHIPQFYASFYRSLNNN